MNASYLWCRAGICAEDFEAQTEDIRAACYARDARVARDKQHSQLITIDVIRRDTLNATRHVSPQVIPGMVLERTEAVNGKAGVFKWQAVSRQHSPLATAHASKQLTPTHSRAAGQVPGRGNRDLPCFLTQVTRRR